jgi:hypothetical protein
MDLGGPTTVAAGRSTPWTMERCQGNLHPPDGEHQQAQAGKSRILRVSSFLYFAWCYLFIENSIQVRERTVRDGLWRSHPLATRTRVFCGLWQEGSKGPARKGVPIEILP